MLHGHKLPPARLAGPKPRRPIKAPRLRARSFAAGPDRENAWVMTRAGHGSCAATTGPPRLLNRACLSWWHFGGDQNALLQ